MKKSMIILLLMLSLLVTQLGTGVTTAEAYTEEEKQLALTDWDHEIGEDFYVWIGNFRYHIETVIAPEECTEKVTVVDVKKAQKTMKIPNTIQQNGQTREVTDVYFSKKSIAKLSKVCKTIVVKGISRVCLSNLSKLKVIKAVDCHVEVKKCARLEKLDTMGATSGDFVAKNCPKLKSISKDVAGISVDGCKSIKKLVISDNLDYSGDVDIRCWGDFYEIGECKKLKTIEYYGAKAFFWDIYDDGTIIDVKLHHVVLVSEKSFRNCPGIRSIVFPSTVEEFQKNVFSSYNYNLRVIKLLGTKVPKMEKTSFRGVPKKCKMYVKTKMMKRAVRNAGFRGKIIVKK